MTVEEYIASIEKPRGDIFSAMLNTVRGAMPEGFEEVFSGGMVHYVVPLSLYPAGYHATPGKPLPFLTVAVQKKHCSLYHMGIYASAQLYERFVDAYTKQTGRKPDIGKSCIRFPLASEPPYTIVAELCAAITPGQWVELYEQTLRE